MENSISQIHLLSVHLNAEKDSVIRNLEDIRAVMSVSYKICDSNAINLMFLTTVNEKEQCLFHLKCEYAFLCHDYQILLFYVLLERLVQHLGLLLL